MLKYEVSRPTVVTAPASEPITSAEAKRQLFIATSDTTHDDDITRTIQVAREQWEHDTDSAVYTQTLSVKLEGFGCEAIYLPSRPIQSITSIAYYDSGDDLQTLSTDVYSLDAGNRAVRLKVDQSWPATSGRWDAITITYVAGYSSVALVPAVAKQAMLLLVGYYFDANRGDNDRPNDLAAYEKLVKRFMRSTYP
jgi:uncharacterized phiE125 gp8 family phage protein